MLMVDDGRDTHDDDDSVTDGDEKADSEIEPVGDPDSRFRGNAEGQQRPGIVVVSVAVVVMAAFIGLLAYSLLTRETMPMDVTTRSNIPAPAFTLSQLNGEGDVSLSDFEGSPIVVNFWASWCLPCRVEMPHLVEAHEQYADDGVRFIGVAISDTNEDALAFIEDFNVPVEDGYVMVTDPDGEATIDYGVGGLPVTFFIQQDGAVHTRWAGVVNGTVLDERIMAILG